MRFERGPIAVSVSGPNRIWLQLGGWILCTGGPDEVNWEPRFLYLIRRRSFQHEVGRVRWPFGGERA
jgi:hypothetical protein